MECLVGSSRKSDDENPCLALVKQSKFATYGISAVLNSTEVVDGNLVHLDAVASRGLQQVKKLLRAR